MNRKQFATLVIAAAAMWTVRSDSAVFGQGGYFPEPPPLARPNGYVYDASRGWMPRASFYGGYNTGPFAGRYGFYRRASPYTSLNRDYPMPRYGGFGPGIGENRRFGGADYYAR